MATGISPNELLDCDLDIFAHMVTLLSEQDEGAGSPPQNAREAARLARIADIRQRKARRRGPR